MLTIDETVLLLDAAEDEEWLPEEIVLDDFPYDVGYPLHTEGLTTLMNSVTLYS